MPRVSRSSSTRTRTATTARAGSRTTPSFSAIASPRAAWCRRRCRLRRGQRSRATATVAAFRPPSEIRSAGRLSVRLEQPYNQRRILALHAEFGRDARDYTVRFGLAGGTDFEHVVTGGRRGGFG